MLKLYKKYKITQIIILSYLGCLLLLTIPIFSQNKKIKFLSSHNYTILHNISFAGKKLNKLKQIIQNNKLNNKIIKNNTNNNTINFFNLLNNLKNNNASNNILAFQIKAIIPTKKIVDIKIICKYSALINLLYKLQENSIPLTILQISINQDLKKISANTNLLLSLKLKPNLNLNLHN